MRSPILVLVLLVSCLGSAWARSANPYEIIDKPSQADQVLREVTPVLAQQFGLTLRLPVELHLVEAKVMDKMFADSPYKGAQVGLYTGVKNGKHQIYVMKGWARDFCAGITAHELTHAWQQENVPPQQSTVVKEGFAMWVEYKYYDFIGAYTNAQRVRETADPVYGVGFFAVFDVENRLGAGKVAQTMRSAVDVKDLPNAK